MTQFRRQDECEAWLAARLRESGVSSGVADSVARTVATRFHIEYGAAKVTHPAARGGGDDHLVVPVHGWCWVVKDSDVDPWRRLGELIVETCAALVAGGDIPRALVAVAVANAGIWLWDLVRAGVVLNGIQGAILVALNARAEAVCDTEVAKSLYGDTSDAVVADVRAALAELSELRLGGEQVVIECGPGSGRWRLAGI